MASLSRDYNRSARRGASEVIRGDVHLVLLLLPFSIGGLLLGGIPHLPVRLWRQRRLEKLALPAANPTRIRASATSSALKSMMAFGPHARPGRRGQAHQARGRAGGRAWQRARKRAKCARPASMDASAAGARPPVGSSAGRRSSRRSRCSPPNRPLGASPPASACARGPSPERVPRRPHLPARPPSSKLREPLLGAGAQRTLRSWVGRDVAALRSRAALACRCQADLVAHTCCRPKAMHVG